MNNVWKKILSVGLVLVMCAVAFSAVVTNVLAEKNDGKEKTMVSLNPCVATNEYIHMVWQENLTGNYEIYVVNDAQHNYEVTLTEAIEELNNSVDKDSQKALGNLNDALNDCLEQDYKHSIDNVHSAVKNLEKAGNTELINILVDSVRDFAKTNILYAEYDLSFNNSYVQEAWGKYYFVAVEKYEEKNYDAAIKQFKNAYLKIVEAYEENDETFNAVDFGQIVRISYTEFDSVNPQIFLNGTINVCWEEIVGNETHAYFARSSNNGITWWYFDATEHAYTYLCYAGINPALLSSENKLLITKTLERILIIDRCHYFYVPIISDGFIIEDRRVYSPIDDPYLILYEYKEPIYIGDKKIYIRCRPGPSPKAPDLTVTDVTFSPSPRYSIQNCDTIIYAYIKNIGSASVSGSIYVRFLDGENQLGRDPGITSLAPGETKEVSMPTRLLTTGTHSIRAVADPDNYVEEGVEGNNEATKDTEVVTKGGDEDNDFLTNYREAYIYNTDLKCSDTDGDGLSDGKEVYEYRTNRSKNIASSATPSSSGGGSGAYAPSAMIDGNTETFCWVFAGNAPGNAYFQLEWTQPQCIDSIFIDTKTDDRTCNAEFIQYWDGSSWITVGSAKEKTDDWIFLFDGITTTKLRLYGVYAVGGQGSNPLIYEWIVKTGGGEVAYFYLSDPLIKDTDNDGLTDSEENFYKTLPKRYDTDSDGIGDKEEINYWKSTGCSDIVAGERANIRDFDNDGLSDGVEIKYCTNPTYSQAVNPSIGVNPSVNDASNDNDNDGISNFKELREYYSDPTTTTTHVYTDPVRKGLIDRVGKEFATLTPYVDGRYALTEPYMDQFDLKSANPSTLSGLTWTADVWPTNDPFYIHVKLCTNTGDVDTGDYIESLYLIDVNGNAVPIDQIYATQTGNGKYYGDVTVMITGEPLQTEYRLYWDYYADNDPVRVIINTDYGSTIDTARIIYTCPEVDAKGIRSDYIQHEILINIKDPDGSGTTPLYFRGHRVGQITEMYKDGTDISSVVKTSLGNYLYVSNGGHGNCPFSFSIGSLPDSSTHVLKVIWQVLSGDSACFRYYIGEQGWDPQSHDLDSDSLSDYVEADYALDPQVPNNRRSLLLCTDDTWPDADIMEDLLLNHYMYTASEILKYEGSAATSTNFQNAINTIASAMDGNDYVYINIGSHGYDGGMYFYDTSVAYATIDGWLDTINCARLVISIDNCHSGSAITPLGTNPPCPRVIYTACNAQETSTGNFHIHFTNALGASTTAYNEADSTFGDGNGYVSVREAFLYAQFHTLQDIGRHAQESASSTTWMTTFLGHYT